MRNLVGGVFASLISCLYITFGIRGQSLSLPTPFHIFEPIIIGAYVLYLYSIEWVNVLNWISGWLILGFVAAIFSKTATDSIRTVLWAGVAIYLLLLMGVFLQNPTFWYSTERNMFLFIWFIRGLLTSVVGIIAAAPSVYMKNRILVEEEVSPPDKIESVCECGATYKSLPRICAQCGRDMNIQSAFTTDGTTQ